MTDDTPDLPQSLSPDFERRFGGLARLYGAEGLAHLRTSHVCVVGVGGVGSWAVEALARSAVGAITLIDMDVIAESNTNRQLPALDPDWGMAKVEALRRRILAINPACQVHPVDDFLDGENMKALITGFDYVIDAIDSVRIKTALAVHCHAQGIPLVVCGAAGGQIDPTRICADDISRTIQDPLLSKMRASLRKQHGFPRDPKKKFGITAVYSTEALRYPDAACGASPAATLNCAGFGSAVAVTASFGFAAAGAAINAIAGS